MLALTIAIAYALASLTIQLIPEPNGQTSRGQIAAPAVRQATQAQNPSGLSQQIAGAHLFGEAGKQEIVEDTTPKDAPETKLNLTLAGVFAYHPAELAVAIISSGGRDEEVYGIGDKIGNATLKAVYPDRVIIENRGREETLRLPEDVQPIALPRVGATPGVTYNAGADSGAPVELPSSPRALRDKLVKNPSMLGKIVSATPYQEGGKLVGYRLQPKQNPEILESQGIMANDVITQVNGIDLNSQKQGIRALRKLVKADSIELTVLRDGIQVPVMISLEQ
ncbi:MAG: type II secretion system protein GspC [Gammaproteobacteria bacterium]|nr:type II secretion system protein GspC [Gammaproteobacteria bacterium]